MLQRSTAKDRALPFLYRENPALNAGRFFAASQDARISGIQKNGEKAASEGAFLSVSVCHPVLSFGRSPFGRGSLLSADGR